MSWTEILTSYPLIQNTFILRRPRLTNFADIETATMFMETTFKDSKKRKRIMEIMYQNAIYVLISWYSKIF